jgi:hypothetical protein
MKVMKLLNSLFILVFSILILIKITKNFHRSYYTFVTLEGSNSFISKVHIFLGSSNCSGAYLGACFLLRGYTSTRIFFFNFIKKELLFDTLCLQHNVRILERLYNIF